MLCKKPFVRKQMRFGCGQCLPCRINRRRLWTHRMMLEATQHHASSFVTLTYSTENLIYVDTEADSVFRGYGVFRRGVTQPSLHVPDLQDWVRSVRAIVRGLFQGQSPVIRYYGVGEYGDQSFRPHYHVALFGLGPEFEEVFVKAWGKGLVHVGELNKDSAAYCAGYVTKKMTSSKDGRLCGRYPEFARMSLKPGIGAGAMQSVGRALESEAGAAEVARLGDVPTQLRHSGKLYPLGRYLARRLRREVGLSEKPPARRQELSSVFEAGLIRSGVDGVPLGKALMEAYQARWASVEGRFKISSSRRSL